MDMNFIYFVLLLAIGGAFFFLLHRQQMLMIRTLSEHQQQAIERLSAYHQQAIERAGVMQDTLNNCHIVYRQELSAAHAASQAEFTRLAQVSAQVVRERNVHDKLFAQFAEQVKIECTKAVGDAAADVLGMVREDVDRGGFIGGESTDKDDAA